jgi:hypothetical protein
VKDCTDRITLRFNTGRSPAMPITIRFGPTDATPVVESGACGGRVPADGAAQPINVAMSTRPVTSPVRTSAYTIESLRGVSYSSIPQTCGGHTSRRIKYSQRNPVEPGIRREKMRSPVRTSGSASVISAVSFRSIAQFASGSTRRRLSGMIRGLVVLLSAPIIAGLAVVFGYKAYQAYLEWLVAGSQNPQENAGNMAVGQEASTGATGS